MSASIIRSAVKTWREIPGPVVFPQERWTIAGRAHRKADVDVAVDARCGICVNMVRSKQPRVREISVLFLAREYHIRKKTPF